MDVYDTKCNNGARLSEVSTRQMKNSSSYSTIEKWILAKVSEQG